jgi:hypothetical protein
MYGSSFLAGVIMAYWLDMNGALLGNWNTLSF